jgi:site-specific DNA-methyltransferase (adenine-specific)
VLDPFAGSGTTLAVAAELGRSGIGCELNPEYVKLACERIESDRGLAPLFS